MGLFEFLESSFFSSLYILDVGGLYVLLTVSFASQKLCSFMRSHLSILDLTAQAIAVLFRNFPPVPIRRKKTKVWILRSFLEGETKYPWEELQEQHEEQRLKERSSRDFPMWRSIPYTSPNPNIIVDTKCLLTGTSYSCLLSGSASA